MVLFGLFLAYFATQNTQGVSISLNEYSLINIPLYVLVIGSLLLGLVISSFFSLLNWVSSFLTLRGKDSQIKETSKVIEELKVQIHDLELENATLKGDEKVVFVEKDAEEDKPKNILDRLKLSLP